jgi:hypothetical protein
MAIFDCYNIDNNVLLLLCPFDMFVLYCSIIDMYK